MYIVCHQLTYTYIIFLQFYKKHMPLTCEIDAYGDFLQALGPDANPEVYSAMNIHM